MIRIRPANEADGNLLFAWRNDPVTQACSRSTAPVAREDHDRWMKFNVLQGYPQHLVMMAETETGTVGTVRFDAARDDLMTFEVSITIAPKFRRLGIASSVLSEACSYMAEYTINAEIKKDNAASRRIFEHCGFEEIGRSSSYLNYRREPVR